MLVADSEILRLMVVKIDSVFALGRLAAGQLLVSGFAQRAFMSSLQV